MSVRAMLTLIILIELHTKLVFCVLVYTKAGVKSDTFMGIPIGFGVEGAHPREWVTGLDKTSMSQRIQTWNGLRNSRKVLRIEIL